MTALARLAVALLLVTLALPATAQSQSGPHAFRVDALNAGLGDVPERLDRQTPRSSLEGFLTAGQREDWNRAAHLLDLAAVPEADQSERGPLLAERLYAILERKLTINFDSLPDRPDGMDALGSNRDPMVGEPRRSLALSTLELDRFPVTIRLNRLLPAGGDAAWVFSSQSVEHVDALYAQYGPTEIERMMPDALRSEAFWGLLVWEIIALPLVILIVGAAGFALYRVLGRVAQTSPVEAVGEGVRRVRFPFVLLIMAIILRAIVSSLFVFSAPVEATISTVFWVLILLALVYGVSTILDTVTDFASNRFLERIDDPENTEARRWYTNLSAAKRIGVIAAVVIGLALALSSLDIFGSFGLSLLVSAGVAAAVFGLAARTVLGNIFASLQLALAKPIRIGDAVYYNDHWAYVEKINFTYVQLRTWDQKRFIVPVQHFVSNPFENWTKDDPTLIMPVLFKVDHRADVEGLRREFARLAADDPQWTEGAEPKVQVIDQDEDGLSVRFYCTADDPTAAWNLHCRMREHIATYLRQLDEPSDLPVTRIVYAADERGPGSGEQRTAEPGAKDTGEPNQTSLGHKEAAE